MVKCKNYLSLNKKITMQMVASIRTRLKGGWLIYIFNLLLLQQYYIWQYQIFKMVMFSAHAFFKDAFMKAPNESSIKDFTEKSTDWIATDGKRCTDVTSGSFFLTLNQRK